MQDPYIGQLVAEQFRITERVGSGGMGAVYKATQPEMNRFVAIKILHARYLERADLLSRFRREAKAMSHLSHPNTAKVFLAGQFDDGTLYYVMEFLEGRTLEQTVRGEGPMSPDRLIRIIGPICHALEEAHQAGIIHRDLKPENIFLTEHGGIRDFPKLLDFGLAKVTERQMGPGSIQLTRKGMVFGTREFMSPEQALGDELDARSDIYSLGVVIYEALTGKLPYRVKADENYLAVQIRSEPIPLSERTKGLKFPKKISQIVHKCIAREPDSRFGSAKELAEALEETLEELPSLSQPTAGSTDSSSETIPLSIGDAEEVVQDHRPTEVENRAPMQASPSKKLPWVVLSIGIVLSIVGIGALVLAMSKGLS